MKVRFIIKEQDENKPVQSPEEVNIRRDNLKSEIQAELTDLNLTTVTPEQLEGLLNQIKIIKGEGEQSLAEKKKEDPVSKKIKMLRDEGKPQDQAVAIALDMERRGKLKEEDGDWFDRLIKWLTGTKAGNTVLDTANKRRGENQVSSAYKGKK